MSNIVKKVKQAKENLKMAKDVLEENNKVMDSGEFMKNQGKEKNLEEVERGFKGLEVKNDR